ncbi:MAG: caspase family protein [Campylobacterota bacterium]|nr:caspase family protein [Campylobacterota bacterium]
MISYLKYYLYGFLVVILLVGCGPGMIPTNKPLSSSKSSKTFLDKRLIGNWMYGQNKFTIEPNLNQLKYCGIEDDGNKKCFNLRLTKLDSRKYMSLETEENKYSIFRYTITDDYISLFGHNNDENIKDDVKNGRIKGKLDKDGSLQYLSDTENNLQKYVSKFFTEPNDYLFYKDHSIHLNKWYKKQYAIVIGIEQYKNKDISYLPNAKNDAEAVSKLLMISGFDVTEILTKEATKQNILNAIKNIKTKLSKDDSIFIYFAGHGKGISLQNGNRVGYIIPYDFDASLKSNEPIDYDESAISLDNLKKYTYNFKAKHVMLALDSCFSGLTFNTRALAQPKSGDMNYYDKLLKRKAINILTAGADEMVSDGQGKHSPFTKYLLKALDEGNLDLEDSDHFATFSELAMYIKTKVAKETGEKQTPQFDKNNEDGEFVFQIHER